MIFLCLSEVSYNQPKFSPFATWDQSAVTFADSTTLVGTSSGIFVYKKNSIYATSSGLNFTLAWTEGSVNVTDHFFNGLVNACSVFVTSSGDVYADNGQNGRVEKWIISTDNIIIAMNVAENCGGLFVDIYDNIYCSVWAAHRVFKKSVDSAANTSVVVAGTGTGGSAADMLNLPNGIFVDTDLNMHVADNANHRIQLFRSGQLNGTTVAGVEAAGTITLNFPTGVVLDGHGYMFIVDRGNNRIVGSGPVGFRCVAACTGASGVAAYQLSNPFQLSFDSHGNLYVTDSGNSRVQKFSVGRNVYGEFFLHGGSVQNPL